MTESHLAHLNLGSNIQPASNLPSAVRLLEKHGDILEKSSVWESEPVGGEGANYWNLCVSYQAPVDEQELKDQIIAGIESQLGRIRTDDKFAPRTIDIDIILFDGNTLKDDVWDVAFVVIPLAEIHPEFPNPNTLEPIRETATRLRQHVWLRRVGEISLS